jgi:hypothetical protein
MPPEEEERKDDEAGGDGASAPGVADGPQRRRTAD